MKHITIGLLFVFVFACKQEVKINKLETGTYRALLEVNNVEDLPFNFEVISENKLNIFNADEVIEVDTVTYKNDSVYMKMPVYEGYLVAKIENNKLSGSFVKASLNKVMPFSAEKNAIRFATKENAEHDVSGNWETVFSPDSEEDTI